MDMIFRLYEPGDRQAVRDICTATAHVGNPIDTVFPDREFVADLVISYYTAHEPQSLWVAEYEGRIVGYLTGSLDQQKYDAKISGIGLKAGLKSIVRGTLCHLNSWRFLLTVMKTWFSGGFNKKILFSDYPAHLHVNIQKDFRGKNTGIKLLGCFLNQVRQRGLSGVYAIVRSDNVGGCQFFEKAGFVKLSQHPAYFLSSEKIFKGATFVFGKKMK